MPKSPQKKSPRVKVDLSDWDFSNWGSELAKAAISFELDDFGNAEIKVNLNTKAFENIARSIASEAIQEILACPEWGHWDITDAGFVLRNSAIQNPEGAITVPWRSLLISCEDDARLLERFVAGAREIWAKEDAAEQRGGQRYIGQKTINDED